LDQGRSVSARSLTYLSDVELRAVRDAYSRMSERYIGMFGDGSQEHSDDLDLVRRHLAGLSGPVLDLGCGRGHWAAYLHSLGARVTGVDVVPEFVAHARASHPALDFRQGTMTALGLPDCSVAGILSWYSTIHVDPSDLDSVLDEYRRLLVRAGALVIGFFDSDDDVAEFDHKVVTAYRWPADVFAARLARAGFVEVERLQRKQPERPDRRYAAIAVRAA
jgi:SAM-dependent methyltransferase